LNGPFDLSDEGDGVVLAEPLRDGLTIVPLADGGLAAAWNEFSGREPKGIHFRLFDVSGNPLTNEIQATPDDHESAESPRMVVVERAGPLVLVWRKRSSDPNASTRIYFRMFSRSGEALSDALPVAVDEPDRSQGLPRLVTDGSQRLLVWYDWSGMQRELADGWIAIRRWSPEDGPVGLTTRFPATFAPYWPLLEAVPDGSGEAFTLFWHADPGDPSGPGRLAWRRVVVPDAR
jgi:hypothetical protein